MKRLKLIAAWLVVGVPLAWGLFHSVQKALPLLQGGAPAASIPGSKGGG